MESSKGQNLVEYILLVVAVVIVCIYFFTHGPMQQSVNSTLNSIVNMINEDNSAIQF